MCTLYIFNFFLKNENESLLPLFQIEMSSTTLIEHIPLILIFSLMGCSLGYDQVKSYYSLKEEPIKVFTKEEKKCYALSLEPFDSLVKLIEGLKDESNKFGTLAILKHKTSGIQGMISALSRPGEDDLDDDCNKLTLDLHLVKDILEGRHRAVYPVETETGTREKRESKHSQILLSPNPNEIYLRNGSLADLDELLKDLCLGVAKGGKLARTINKGDCAIEVISVVKTPVILNIGPKGRALLKDALMGITLRSQASFLSKMGSYLQHNYQKNELSGKKGEILELLDSYIAMDKPLAQEPATTPSTTGTTTVSSTTMAMKDVLTQIGSAVADTQVMGQKNKDDISVIEKEDVEEDNFSFKSSLSFTSHILDNLRKFITDPINSNLVAAKNSEVRTFYYDPAQNSIVLTLRSYEAQTAYMALPLDLCGYHHCLHISSAISYLVTGEDEGFAREDCSFVKFNTYKCTQKIILSADSCMVLKPLPEIYEEQVCIIEDGGAPSSKVMVYGDKLLITMPRDQNAVFGNENLLPSKIYELSSKKQDFYLLLGRTYLLEACPQTTVYKKKTLPFTPQDIDHYFAYLIPQEYSDMSTWTYINTGTISYVSAIVMIVCCLVYRNRSRVLDILDREQEYAEQQAEKKIMQRKKYHAPTAPDFKNVSFPENKLLETKF